MAIDKEYFIELCYKNEVEKLEDFIENNFSSGLGKTLKDLFITSIHKKDMISEGLIYAARNNNIEIVKELLTNKYTKNSLNLKHKKSSAFRIACKHGHLDIIKMLADNNFIQEKPEYNDGKIGARFKVDDNTLINSEYGTPIGLATENNHIEVISYILSNQDIAINITMAALMESFHKALENGSVLALGLIKEEILTRKTGFGVLDKWGGFNKSTFDINNSLTWLLENNHMDMVCYLIKEFHYKHQEVFDSHVSESKKSLNEELKRISENLYLYEKLNSDTKESSTIEKRKIKL